MSHKLNQGDKAWFVEHPPLDVPRKCTLHTAYFIAGGTEPWWSVKLSRKGTQPTALRYFRETDLYPSKRVALMAHRMGL